MKIIGICGPSGSGKSFFADLFRSESIAVLDCDKIYHSLTNSRTDCLSAIEERFGSEIVSNDRLNRKALARIVFHDRDQLRELNVITHKYVLEVLDNEIKKLQSEGKDAVVIDAPLLFESGLDLWCDCTCCLVSDRKTQIERICKRDGITESAAEERLDHQVSADALSEKCNFTVTNTGDVYNLCKSRDEILKELNVPFERRISK